MEHRFRNDLVELDDFKVPSLPGRRVYSIMLDILVNLRFIRSQNSITSRAGLLYKRGPGATYISGHKQFLKRIIITKTKKIR